MPRQFNIAYTSFPTVAWDGVNSYADDIRFHTQFGWGVQVIGDIATDAVFAIEFAAPSIADDCAPGPFEPYLNIANCRAGPAGDPGQLIIAAGTLAGYCGAGTIPCHPGAFIRLNPVSGDTDNVRIGLVRHGPKLRGSENDPYNLTD